MLWVLLVLVVIFVLVPLGMGALTVSVVLWLAKLPPFRRWGRHNGTRLRRKWQLVGLLTGVVLFGLYALAWSEAFIYTELHPLVPCNDLDVLCTERRAAVQQHLGAVRLELWLEALLPPETKTGCLTLSDDLCNLVMPSLAQGEHPYYYHDVSGEMSKWYYLFLIVLSFSAGFTVYKQGMQSQSPARHALG